MGENVYHSRFADSPLAMTAKLAHSRLNKSAHPYDAVLLWCHEKNVNFFCNFFTFFLIFKTGCAILSVEAVSARGQPRRTVSA
jgi:hypothetical protein